MPRDDAPLQRIAEKPVLNIIRILTQQNYGFIVHQMNIIEPKFRPFALGFLAEFYFNLVEKSPKLMSS